jgi:replicative DNA helicase
MSDEQLGQRVISSEAGINSQALRLGQLQEEDWAPFLQTVSNLQGVPLFIDDTPALSVQEMRSKAKRIKAEQDIDLLIIDYLQLMEAGIRATNTVELVTHISRNIKRIARELNIPVVALSQLSRAVEGRQDKRPLLSDLRSSGSIEQDSDIVIFIYRDEMYNPDTEFPNIAEIILAKHRHGPTGVTSVYFRKSQAQFLDLEVRKQPLNL